MVIGTVELARDLRVLVGRLRRRVKEVADAYELTASQLAVVSRLDRAGPATASGGSGKAAESHRRAAASSEGKGSMGTRARQVQGWLQYLTPR